MDVHVFRRFCDALIPVLQGARLEKIQSPLENVFVLTFYAQQRKQHLVFKVGRRDAFCYLAKERPVTDAPPSAMIMRWRKYCVGRRIASCSADWVGRRLLFLFHTSNPQAQHTQQLGQETWLVLDLREGIQLFLGKSPSLEFAEQTLSWPEPLHMADACDNWRQWPMLSPALRRLLPVLDPLDAQALLMDLEMGGGDMYVYESGLVPESTLEAALEPEGNAPLTNSLKTHQDPAITPESESCLRQASIQKTPVDQKSQQGDAPIISAWPLPDVLRGMHRYERVFENPLEATSCVGDLLVLGAGAEKLRSKAALPHQREAARLQRLLEKLQEDEKRLEGMAKAQELGLVLQGIIWKYPAHSKEKYIETHDATYPRIELDGRLTVRENMQAFFHKAGRGRRGLQYLQKRRQELEEQLLATQSLASVVGAGAHNLVKAQKNTVVTQKTLPKGVQAFKSSDGFIILRGKDAKGNGAALRAAAAKDIWLHVEGGPGSHCIIRRHFSGQEIPERTLQEAASLAAVKSWQRDNPTAQILCAEVRHIKPMRGAALGTVRIDKVLRSFTVQIEENIENKLAV